MSGRVTERLAELGIALPEVSAPAGAYVPAVVSGNLVFTAGQLPFVGGLLGQTGKVGESSEGDGGDASDVASGAGAGALGAGAGASGAALVSPSDAKAMAQIAALNALAAVQSVIGSLDRVTQVVKVTGFVASDPAFTGQPGVINGASEFLVDVFGSAGIHARSAVGVAVLPLDSPVEVELIVSFE
ncbi:RidA family protein [Subtercola lobariae]|uniref:LysR family transcriptional regulator n=1 Tax=Subtercola lobariae TaxID=1588641 RepID=A0A917EVQ2_9MICO|nr:RidA family protein [Subtercola lobariae]GGF13213.1 LysR family transcriptional regulator [Subtercola lobariae]